MIERIKALFSSPERQEHQEEEAALEPQVEQQMDRLLENLNREVMRQRTMQARGFIHAAQRHGLGQ